MLPIRTLIEKGRGTVRGLYRLRRPRLRHTRKGCPYVALELEDMSGRVPAYLWAPDSDTESLLQDLRCVEVVGAIRRRRDGIVLDVERIGDVQDRLGEVVRLIPQSVCPLPWLLYYLDAWVAHLTDPHLRQFTLNVLGDDGLAFLFVSAPASLRHHHAWPGGLLQHSLECVQSVFRHPQFGREQMECGMVAALFHDIGKVLTLTADMRRTSLGQTLDHDKLTLEVLAPHLKWLDRHRPAIAADLRYLLTWRKGRRDGRIPRLTMAEVVRSADRISAGLATQGQ
ncbi:3'-5' exoribonuclease [Geothermobacter ehrlichii]|uniref:3'-5' exoribonuclease n=1 Tax=Geothermobacter ehrlichii TaxID=213224 RepID=A0A5D3WHY4_9BACT|nr:TraI domain-containing protein [Geothermobacter ehrlichii]TYO96335.1 3'-5' exoribonuclease [Geothermobacter ehrlichii]